MTNALSLRETLVRDGAIFRTTSDTETIVQLIAKSQRDKFAEKLIEALFQIKGGYALVLMTNKINRCERSFWYKTFSNWQIKQFIYICL